MLDTKRLGETGLSSSRRVQVTAPAGSAPTFLVTKTRPVVVAAHAVVLSAVVRSTAATAPPALSAPCPAPFRATASIFTQSPHGRSKAPVHSLQRRCASS